MVNYDKAMYWKTGNSRRSNFHSLFIVHASHLAVGLYARCKGPCIESSAKCVPASFFLAFGFYASAAALLADIFLIGSILCRYSHSLARVTPTISTKKHKGESNTCNDYKRVFGNNWLKRISSAKKWTDNTKNNKFTERNWRNPEFACYASPKNRLN